MDILSLIVGILGVVLGGGGIIAFFTLKQERRSRELDNEIKAISEWQEIASIREKEIDDLRKRLDVKNEQLFDLQEKVSDLRALMDDLNTQIAKGRLLRCTKIQCMDRKPPFGWDELSKSDLTDLGVAEEDVKRYNLEAEQ